MADFSLSQIGETAPSGARPTPGVQQPSAVEAGAGLLSSLFQVAASGAPQRAAEAKAEREAFESSVAGRFQRQQMQIAEAVDTGGLSSQEARMRMRANLSSALADNPGLTEVLTKSHSDVIETAGMGKVAAEGTEQEKAFFKAQDAATQAGWVIPGMTQEEAQASTFAYTQFNREQSRIDAEQNQLALENAKVSLGTARIQQGTARISQESARLSLAQKRAEQGAKTGAGAMADAGMVRFSNKAAVLRRQVEAGDISREAAVQELDNEWLTISSSTRRVGRNAGGEYLSNLVKPIEDVYNANRGWLTGETQTATLEAISANAIARQTNAIAGDPEMARLVATSNMFGNSASIVTDAAISNRVANYLSKNSVEEGRAADLTDPDDANDVNQYLRILKDNVSNVNSGNTMMNPDETAEEVRVNVNNVLKGIGNYGNLVDNPAQLNNITTFLSSDDFGRYVESNGTGVNQDNLSQANEVFQAQFDEVVRPLIAEEWRNAAVNTSLVPAGSARGGQGGRQEAAASLIRPFFSGSGVRFVQSDDSRKVPGLAAKIDSLNKKVAPVMNRLVRLGAHLEGHRDYRRIYEANYANIFGDAGTGAEVDDE